VPNKAGNQMSPDGIETKKNTGIQILLALYA